MEITTFANYFTEKKNYRENQDEWGTVLCTNQTDKLSVLPNPSLEQFPFPKEVVRKMEVLVISPLAIWDFPFTPSLFLESFDTILAIKWQNNFFFLILSLSWHIYTSLAWYIWGRAWLINVFLAIWFSLWSAFVPQTCQAGSSASASSDWANYQYLKTPGRLISAGVPLRAHRSVQGVSAGACSPGACRADLLLQHFMHRQLCTGGYCRWKVCECGYNEILPKNVWACIWSMKKNMKNGGTVVSIHNLFC